MSYILEALKRAEKERKLGQTPAALEEVAIPQADTSQVRRRWLLIGAGAVLLVAAVIYGVMRLLHGGAAAPTTNVAAAPVAAAPAPAIAARTPEAAPAAVQASESAEPASPTAGAPNADAKIADGDSIASLDDLTGDSANGQAAEGPPSNDDAEQNLPPPGPTIDLGSSDRQAVGPPPLPKPAAVAQSARPPAQQAVQQPKPVLIKPEIRPAAPAPVQRAAVQPAQAPVVRGPRAPPAGPVVVLGENPQVIEASPPSPSPTRGSATKSSAAAPVETPTAQATTEAEISVDDSDAAAAAAAAAEKSATAPAPVRPATRSEKAATAAATAGTRERADRIESLRRFKEMPPAYRADFPALTVDVHVYNADAQRSFVIINGKRYRAGDSLTEGPRIVEIVSEGIVFEWHNEKVLYALGR